MIRINLASRKQSASVPGESRSSLGGNKSEARLDDLKSLPLRQIGLMLVVAAGATYLLDDFKQAELKKVAEVAVKIRTEQARLKSELVKTKDYEENFKSLEADEATLRAKTEVIQKLLTDRQLPPKMMMPLATAIPQDVWLKSVDVKDQEVSSGGSAMGFN